MKYLRFAIPALLAATSTSAFAQSTGETVAAKFGALEAVRQASISPDGKLLAFVAEAEEGSRVYVADLAAGGQPRKVFNIPRTVGRISTCSWPASFRIVCRGNFVSLLETSIVPISRLYAVNADATGFKELTAPEKSNYKGFDFSGGRIIDLDVTDQPGVVLMTREFLADDGIGTHLGSSKEGLGVEQVDTISLKRKTVEPPREGAITYVTDGQGTVRLMGVLPRDGDGYVKGNTLFYFRKPGTREWTKLSSVNEDDSGFAPQAVDGSANVVYGLDDDGDFDALYTMTLDDAQKKTKVLGHDGIDIDGVVAIGRQRRVIGATYATERRTIEYFDPKLKSLSASLTQALPNHPAVYIADASQDESKLLISASSDTQPGQFYLYDQASKRLEEILPVRPELADVKLATMKPITFPAADGTMIPGYLTLPPGSDGKNIPAIVMPHGGPAARDEWGFDWLSQFFAQRGFAVLQPNYRGSTGYGSQFYQKNGFKSWRTAIGDVNDAGRWLLSQGFTSPDKLAIVGWSYGGYAALQSAVLDPTLFKAIVAVAPVVDLQKLKDDAAKFANGPVVARFVGSGPEVSEGSPAQNAGRFTAPVLMFGAELDMNVDVSQPRLMERKLKAAGKDVTYIEFPALEHQLYDAKARTRLLAESDAFLRKHLGLPTD